jgi:hypothetical protein
MQPAPKDMQKLPNALRDDTNQSSDQSVEDAVLSIDSVFQSNIIEEPGHKRNANW